ncbi:hypothetical protein MHN84_26400 [Mycobacterium sp. PSTR-4-N]|nr:hypothetical protein [Mycobacterium sp. PSTR-4-N]MCG7597539.1 hypothetical protein [Mycobacterium sp. PSTR-4-N]
MDGRRSIASYGGLNGEDGDVVIGFEFGGQGGEVLGQLCCAQVRSLVDEGGEAVDVEGVFALRASMIPSVNSKSVCPGRRCRQHVLNEASWMAPTIIPVVGRTGWAVLESPPGSMNNPG